MDDGEAKISTAEIVLLPLDIHHPPISFEFKCESCVNNPGLTGDAFYRDLHALNVLDVTSFLSQFNCDNLFKNKSLDDMIKQNDPCRDKECLFGSRCTVNPDGRNATCICPDKCPNYGDHTTSRPVCGSDGVNYGNQCELQRAACSSQTNITIKFYGKCGICGENGPCSEHECQFGGTCIERAGTAHCECPECPAEFEPICGSDGISYSNECKLRLEACKHRRNITVLYRGPCNLCQGVQCKFGGRCEAGECVCPKNCEEAGEEPVCASDMMTYPNECELLKARCAKGSKTAPISVVFYGDCREKFPSAGSLSTTFPNLTEQRTNQKTGQDMEVVVPQLTGNSILDGITTEKEACKDILSACMGSGILTKIAVISANVVIVDSAPVVFCCNILAACMGSGILTRIAVISANVVIVDSAPVEKAAVKLNNGTVCGTDGITYPSECELRQASCKTKQYIILAYKGNCGFKPRINYCNDKEGNLLTNKDDILLRWVGHFQELLEGEPTNNIELEYRNEELVEPPSVEEVKISIEKLRNHKSPGSDGIPAELFKHGGEQITKLSPQRTEDESEIDDSDNDSDFKVTHPKKRRLVVPAIVRRSASSSTSTSSSSSSCASDCTECLNNQNSLPAENVSRAEQEDGANVSDTNPLSETVVQFSEQTSPVQDKICKKRRKQPQKWKSNVSKALRNSGQAYQSMSKSKKYISERKVRPPCGVKWMEVKPCKGEKPLTDPVTERELDCGNGPFRQDCPAGSYCHQTAKFSKCCRKNEAVVEKKDCEESWFGCCPDGKTPAQGQNFGGCPSICECNKLGSYSDICDPETKQCKCKPGVGGTKCDRCEPGFWGLPKISAGYQGCIPCGCSTFGSVRDDCEQMTGRCVCKPGVQGQKCTICTNHNKYLGPNGCVSATDLASMANPSTCAERNCYFGAVCIEKDRKALCECHLNCTNSRDSQVVCGSDGKTYSSSCDLRRSACKLQRDIVLQGFGSCKDDIQSTDWPYSGVNPKQFTQPDEISSPLSKSTRHLLVPDPRYYYERSSNVHPVSFPGTDFGGNEPNTNMLYRNRANSADMDEFPACSSSPCNHGGTCIDLPASTYACVCTANFTGLLCELEITLTQYETPAFHGKSYARLRSLKAYHKLSIEVEFQSYTEDGVILYNQQKADGLGDFVSLAIINGFVEFKYNLGNGAVLIRSVDKIKKGEDHKVVIRRYHRDGVLKLDESEEITGQSSGSLKALDLLEDAFIGYVPTNYTRVYDNIGTSKGFQGCIKKLRIGRQEVEIHMRQEEWVLEVSGIYDCSDHACKFSPCQNKGKCLESDQLFQCDCPPKFTGEYCEKFEGPCIGEQCMFATDCQNKKLGIPCQEVTQNKWHRVVISREGREGRLQVDNSTEIQGYSGTPLTELNLETPLYIGSINNWKQIHRLSGASKGFKGIIQKVTFNHIPLHISSPLPDCTPAIPQNDSQCVSNIAYYEGTPCPPGNNPCLNNGICVPELDNFTCKCNGKYKGRYCETIDEENISIKLNGATYLQYTNRGYRSENLTNVTDNDEEIQNTTIEDEEIEHDNDFLDEHTFDYDVEDLEVLRKPERGNRYELKIRTFRSEGLILWRSKNRNQLQNYLSIAIVDGYPELSFNLGHNEPFWAIRSRTKVDDGEWHLIQVRRRKRMGFISVDGHNTNKGVAKTGAIALRTNSKLWIGGTSTLPLGLPSSYYKGFEGCIQKILIHGKPIDLLANNDISKINFCHDNEI
uniref:Agrin-like n=1 Tax=Diabrotica virgifera virgifera TaxID=50390 RepID=A0A6P7FT13_DIAVI